MDHRLNIAIFSPGKNVYSETFIRAHVERLSGNIFVYYGWAPSGYLNNEQTRLNKGLCRKIMYRITGIIRGIKHLDYHKALLRSLRENGIDTILVEFGTKAAEIRYTLERAGIPFVIHFHGYDAFEFDVIKRHKTNYQRLFGHARHIISVSEAMTRQLVRLGCPVEKVKTSPCGPHPAFGRLKNVPVHGEFISVGRFKEKKAPLTTIRAFAPVVKKFPGARLTMVGEGELLLSARQLIIQLGLQNNIRLAGVKTAEEIMDHYTRAFCFLMHSVTAGNGDREGTPVSILEASLAGLPVISTRHSGITDVVVDRKTGLLTDEYDQEEMTKHIIYLMQHPEKAKKMGAAGRVFVMENYSMDIHIGTIRGLLES